MDYLEAYRQAFAHLPSGAKEAEVNAETHRITDIAVENGEMTKIETSEKTALYVRVSGEKTGYVYTEDLEEDASQVLERAYENSFCSNREKPEALNREAGNRSYETAEAIGEPETLNREAGNRSYETAEAIGEPEQLEGYAAAMEKELLEKSGIIQEVYVSLKAETVDQRTLNSYGLDAQCVTPLYIMRVTAGLREGEKNYTFSYLKSAKSPDAFQPEEFRRNLEAGLESQKNPASGFVSGDYPVILSARVVCNLFITAWQLFSGYKYAEKSTALAGMLSKRLGKDVLNITDYPEHPDSGFVMKYDCEGSEGKPVKLVENGIFTGLMTNAASAQELGLPCTGNAGRRPLLFGNIATDILVTPKNFVIEPGTSTVEELMEHMGDGVYITTSYDVFHTVNISSGDFSVPCKGTRIRDGKRAENVTAISISGNLKDFFAQIEEVGNDLLITPMEDLENYGIGACSIRLRSCRVSGE
ncbi:MAG: TldD/PmbA family protein [Eubacteriales bacterium]|nr:TldD/PmbA family protein [Eubacteriales bacterium]